MSRAQRFSTNALKKMLNRLDLNLALLDRNKGVFGSDIGHMQELIHHHLKCVQLVNDVLLTRKITIREKCGKLPLETIQYDEHGPQIVSVDSTRTKQPWESQFEENQFRHPVYMHPPSSFG